MPETPNPNRPKPGAGRPALHVCYVAAGIQLPNVAGLGTGGSTHVYEVARHLMKRGCHLRLVCMKGEGQADAEDYQGIHLRRLFRWKWQVRPDGPVSGGRPGVLGNRPGWLRLMFPLFRHARSFLHAFRVVWALKSEKTHVIYERFSPSTLAGSLAAILLRKPLVVELNEDSCHWLTLWKASAIIAPDISNIPVKMRSKAVQLEWAVDPDLFVPAEPDGKLLQQLGLKGRRTFVFTGSCLPWHGLMEIVKAVDLLKEDCPDIAVLVVGDGPERSLAEREARGLGIERLFRFVGQVPYFDVPKYINLARIGLAPYTHQLSGRRARMASPLKVLEYMACAKPVIITEAGNRYGVIREDMTGWVAESSEPSILKAKLQLALEAGERWREMGRQGRALVVERFSWAEHCRRLHEVLEKSVAS